MTSFSQVADRCTQLARSMSSSTSRDPSSDEFQSFNDNSDSESMSGSSSHDIGNGKEEIVNYDDSVEPVPTEEELRRGSRILGGAILALHCTVALGVF